MRSAQWPYSIPPSRPTNKICRASWGKRCPSPLYLFSSRDKSLEDALAQLAKEHAGKLLVARVDVSDNPGAHNQYGRPTLPALLTISGGTVLTKDEGVHVADLRPHVDYLLGRGPKPPVKSAQPAPERPANGGATPVKITDASFQKDVLQSNLPVLVDFWAPWCGPCLSIAPTLERMAGEFAGRVKIAKLNVDENPRMSEQFTVRAIPTFITFKNGKLIRRQSGANPTLIGEYDSGGFVGIAREANAPHHRRPTATIDSRSKISAQRRTCHRNLVWHCSSRRITSAWDGLTAPGWN